MEVRYTTEILMQSARNRKIIQRAATRKLGDVSRPDVTTAALLNYNFRMDQNGLNYRVSYKNRVTTPI